MYNGRITHSLSHRMRMKNAIVPLLAALILAGAGCLRRAEPTPAEPAPAPAPSDSLGIRIAGNFIYAPEQRPGDEVVVAQIANDAKAFIVIRQDNETSGAVLGASALLEPGENDDVRIAVSRPTRDGETLYAAVYADEGNGVYDGTEATLKDGLGNSLYSIVTISVNAVEGQVMF